MDGYDPTRPVQTNPNEPLTRLFVYGIFLDRERRNQYGMSRPRYDTVQNYITVGNVIVEAIPVNPELGAALTGLVVDVDPAAWASIDALEASYDRIEVETILERTAYMYVRKERNGEK